MHSHDADFTFYVHSKTGWLAEARIRLLGSSTSGSGGTPLNVRRKPISEMSTVCCGTCQTTRGSRHSVGKLKVGSAIIEGFRLTLALRGYGPRSRFSEDITRNRMQVCWNFLLESGARKICAWKIVAIHYHYHFFPRLAWAKKTHFPSPARIMSLGGKHI